MDRPKPPTELVCAEESFRIRSAAFAVSNAIGYGFLEGVYQECLALEFAAEGIPFQSMPKLPLIYRGQTLRQTYSPDFVCYGSVIVELKAARAIAPEHRAQVLNYLAASRLKVGLLVNFGSGPKVQIERFAL
jgi:GxxExxY protein